MENVNIGRCFGLLLIMPLVWSCRSKGDGVHVGANYYEVGKALILLRSIPEFRVCMAAGLSM